MDFFFAVTSLFQSTCTFGTIYRPQWIEATALIVLATMAISSFIYAVGSVLPIATRERLRGVVRYELVQGVISMLLVVSLITFALPMCSTAALLTGNSAQFDPYQFAHLYLHNLLYSKGIGLATTVWSEGISFIIDGNLDSAIANIVTSFSIPTPFFSLGVSPGSELVYIAYDYATTFSGVFTGIIMLTFGILFSLYFIMPLIEQFALITLIPTAVILRSISFSGPRLREAANSVIALAIALYFIFPMTISMNYYITGWLYCTNKGTVCNPYSAYLGKYPISNIPVSSLFSSNQAPNIFGYGTLSVPFNYYFSYAQSGTTGFYINLIKGFFDLPDIINSFVPDVGAYFFEGIVLIALDLAMTVGFAIGFTKGLNSLSSIMGVGPFWGA